MPLPSPAPAVGRFCLTLFSLCLAAPLLAATYWVHPEGDDDAAGTREAPWASPQKAVDTARAGDTVVFRGGTYLLTDRITFRHSGTAEAWITFRGYPGEKPLFDGENFIPQQGQHDLGLLEINGPDYLRLINLHVHHSHQMGFHVGQNWVHENDDTPSDVTRFIEIIDCTSDFTFAPGIGLWRCEDIRVLHCEVTRANTNELRLYGDFNREAPHESISVAYVDGFEVAYNHVHNGDKEGIDVKEASRNGIVHSNYVHSMPRQGLYADAWFGRLENVEFRHNVVHNCEWGIAVSAEGNAATLDDVRILHNLFYYNRGSGLFFSLWNGDMPRSNVVIAHNTFYNNGSYHHWSGPTGSIDLRSDNVSNITIVNNICLNGGAYEIGTFDDPEENGLDMLAERNVIISHNLTGTFQDRTDRSFLYGRNYAILGDNPITGDPELLAAFRGAPFLSATSIARNAGIDDPAWHDEEGNPADLGAFPFGYEMIPDEAPSMREDYDGRYVLIQSTRPGREYFRESSTDGINWTSDWVPGNGVPDRHIISPEAAATQLFRYRVRWIGFDED